MAPRRTVTSHITPDGADKENSYKPATPGLAKPPTKSKKKALGEKNNACSTEQELEVLTKKLSKICLEKERAEQLLMEKEATIEQQKEQLELKEAEKGKLEEKLKKLQKLKAFTPTINLTPSVTLANNPGANKKKRNDHDRVKKPQSAFLLWCKDQREQIKAKNPEASFKEMSVILGEKWKNTPEEEKKSYEAIYEKEVYLKLVGKERRNAEALKLVHEEQNKRSAMELLEQYLQHMKESSIEAKSKKKKKDPEEPKRPLSAFFIFCNERRAGLIDEKLKVPEIGKRLGDEWKNMNESLRAPYEKIAADAKAKYDEELQIYKQKKLEEDTASREAMEEKKRIEQSQGLLLLKQKEKIDQAKKVLKEQRMQKRKIKVQLTDPNKPKKPPTSFQMFGKEERKRILQSKPGTTFSEISTIVASKWKELDASEKQMWADKAAVATEKYTKDLDEYNRTQRGALLNCESASTVISTQGSCNAAQSCTSTQTVVSA